MFFDYIFQNENAVESKSSVRDFFGSPKKAPSYGENRTQICPENVRESGVNEGYQIYRLSKGNFFG